MRIFYGLLMIVTAVLLTVKPENATLIIATSLVTAGLIALLPQGDDHEKKN